MSETLTLQEKLKRLPTQPGVYLFKDASDTIIYIGKAKVLRNRVRSYFQSPDSKDFKTRKMVPKIVDLDWIVLPTEVEALIAEQDLVRHHQPRYNIMLKDDKSFPFLKITKEPYPQILLTRRVERDGHRYLGPYTDVRRLRETLQVLHKIFPIRTCTYHITDETIEAKKHKVCLDYHIKRCFGPCEGLQSEAEYNEMIDQVVAFLQGRSEDIMKSLKVAMETAAADLRYEDAAKFRDQFQSMQHYANRQAVISRKPIDRDVLNIDVASTYGVGVVLRIRQGRLLGKEKFDLVVSDPELVEDNVLGFLKAYYTQADFIPPEILMPIPMEPHGEIKEWLEERAGHKVTLIHPQRGDKVDQLAMARRNASLMLNEIKIKKTKRRELLPNSVERLQEDLGLEVPPRRIEGFDNSNIQGEHPVSSMVCFIDGKPRKGEYRKFHIKTVEGADDYASMYEVVSRRYKRVLSENGPLPDLVLIDGGKGQLSMAKAALNDLGLMYLPVVGLAKRLEEVFRPGHSESFNIPKHSAGLLLLRRVRDEAHRFAITFHRQVRSKKMTTSVLDDIPGVGPKRLKKIWTTFANLQEIADAEIADIASRAGVPEALALLIKERAQTVNRST